MSWIITEKSQTGGVQYIIGTHPTLATGATTDSFNISGYVIDISFIAANATASGAILEGSLNGTNFFTISTIDTVTTNPPVNDIRCEIAVKFIRLMNSSGGNFTSITFSAEA